MKMKNKKHHLRLAAAALILSTLACSFLQVGVVTPTGEEGIQPINKEIEPTPASETEEAEEELQQEEGPVILSAVAWQGHIASMPEGSQYDDVLILNPEGSGEYGLTGATPEVEAEIRALRDGEGPQMYVHLWGNFSCGVEDVNNCQLMVERLQYGANLTEEEISNWVGTIKGFNFNMGPTYGFVLDGEVPMHYGIYASQDPSLQAEIESLRDTGTLVQVSGKLLVGFPDVNSTRIEISSLRVLDEGSQVQPTLESFDPTAGWQVFTSNRYGYQIKYPDQATLTFFGPEGFSLDDLPASMTPEEYLDALLKEYTDQLCVRIEYSLGFIFISAPPNNQGELLVHCGVPGWGAGELNKITRDITLGGELYTVTGTEFIASPENNDGTLNSHLELFTIDLEDGIRIVYGATPRTDATYEDYLMKTQEILERIISTYQSVQ